MKFNTLIVAGRYGPSPFQQALQVLQNLHFTAVHKKIGAN
jgi:hypothetical protein